MKRLLFAFLALSAALQAAQPNFLIILADDHGYGDVSAYHDSDVRTPNIDRIGKEGLLFTAMRANCTVCSPSRAALLTGRYADRVGVPGVIRTKPEDSWGYFKPGVPTIADELKKAGYHTGIIGKWHLGLESPNTPNERGFDHFHGFLGDMMDSYTTHLRHGNNYMRLNAEVIDPQGHATDLFTDWAGDYLRERAKSKDKPFFLYLAYNAPHFPIEPPAEWLAKVKDRAPQLDEKRAMNVAFVEHLDDRLGHRRWSAHVVVDVFGSRMILEVLGDLGFDAQSHRDHQIGLGQCRKLGGRNLKPMLAHARGNERLDLGTLGQHIAHDAHQRRNRHHGRDGAADRGGLRLCKGTPGEGGDEARRGGEKESSLNHWEHPLLKPPPPISGWGTLIENEYSITLALNPAAGSPR